MTDIQSPPKSATITHIGPLKGKDRPHYDTRNRRTYTPSKTQRYEKALRKDALARWGNIPTDKPVAIRITAYKAIPKSYTKANKILAAYGRMLPTSRPDLDNIVKIVLDALNGVVYTDDRQVVRLEALKEFTGTQERVMIEIRTIEIEKEDETE